MLLRPVRGMFRPLSAGLFRTLSGTVRGLPENLALVEIDRADAAVRRLHNRQSTDGETSAAPASGSPLAVKSPMDRL